MLGAKSFAVYVVKCETNIFPRNQTTKQQPQTKVLKNWIKYKQLSKFTVL